MISSGLVSEVLRIPTNLPSRNDRDAVADSENLAHAVRDIDDRLFPVAQFPDRSNRTHFIHSIGFVVGCRQG